MIAVDVQRRCKQKTSSADKATPNCLISHDGTKCSEQSESCSKISSHLCDECGKTFSTRGNLTSHISSHTAAYNCSECHRNYRSLAKLSEHWRVHSGERPYLCTFCGRSFYTASLLSKHQLVHTREKPLRCVHCAARFGRHDHLKIHVVRVHEPHRLLVCPQCDGKFVFAYQLREHTLIHTGQKPHACTECGQSFRTKFQLQAHQQWKHVRSSKSIVGGNSPLPASFSCQQHHHRLEEIPCPKCNRIIRGKYYMALHLRRHAGDFRFRCDECGKGFAFRSELAVHKAAKHSAEKQFACTDCDRRYSTRKGLEQHRRTHTGEKPCVCVECGLRFMFNGQLYVHRRQRHNLMLRTRANDYVVNVDKTVQLVDGESPNNDDMTVSN